tara:strand:- start:3808 stop:4725 length:918 start_codon:yes stop_codon:yes gene_type:complete
MLLENKIIIIIKNFNQLNCSFLKGFLIYLKLKPSFNNLILIDYDNKIKLYENKKFIKKELEFKNNIILFNKFLPDINTLKILKKNNNILIHEIIDFFYNKKYNNYKEYFEEYTINNTFIFDKIIVNSNHMKNQLINYFNNIDVIYHQYDHRIKLKNNKINKIYYIGLKNKLELSDKIINECNIKIMNNSKIKKYILNAFSCIQVCFIKKNNNLFDTYTSTKLATAIITNSIFICNKIPVFVELLGNDYEFYCDDENNLINIIEKAKITFNDEIKYDQYLQKYSYLKNKLDYKNLLINYKNLFNKS